MTDARRPDLNYGHFGEPVYDVESHEWSFPRSTNNALRLRQLGQPRLLLPPQLATLPASTHQTAAQRHKVVRQLVRAHPELAPGASLLPSLAETSEAIQQSRVNYDPATSDLLAFGRALHPLHHRESPRFVPIVSVPGGAAGEFVRVVQLVPEIVDWGEESAARLHAETFQSRVQGLWYGNGSRIQQLQFARSNGEPSEWLAVRYGGTTSILRVILEEKEVPMPCGLPRSPLIEANVELRMKLEHIATVSTQQSGGASHADVCFNPSDPRAFALLDQSSCWSTWKIISINQKRGTWRVEAGNSGDIAEDLSNDARSPAGDVLNHDGWGAVRWISEGACLLVCNRWRLACVMLQERPIETSMPDLAFTKAKDWILDIREAPTRPGHLFVATVSRIFWLQLTVERTVTPTARQDQTQTHLSAQVLFTCVHFRNELDTSLWMQVVVFSTTTKVLLCSRLTGLKTVFTFDNPQALHSFPPSVCDPYLFPEQNDGGMSSSTCLTLALRLLPYKRRDDRTEGEARSWYMKCVVLSADLSLHERFMIATSLDVRDSIEAPRFYDRPRPLRKSSYRVDDDFVVPNGMLDIDVQDAQSTRASSLDVIEQERRPTARSQSSPLLEDQWTINLEWLMEYINSAPNTPLQEASQFIIDRLSERMESRVPGIVSLEELIDQEVAVGDIDELSTAFDGFLKKAESGWFGRHAASVGVPEEPISISRLTTMSLPAPLQFALGSPLIQTYDALLLSWVMSLSHTVAARLRARTERTMRCVAAELHLASYGVSMQSRDGQASEQPPMSSNEEPATFTIPVRGMPLFSQESRRVRAKAIEQASVQLQSPQKIDEQSSVPAATLPTPEPTPSLRSHGSQGSQSIQGGMEDATVLRLRALANVAHQPLLPVAIKRNLDHWVIDQTPDDYDWKQSNERAEQGGKPEDAEEAGRAKKRRRKERSANGGRETLAVSSSQPLPSRLAASQVEVPSHPQYSSQASLVPASQPVPGPHGGAIKPKKGRKKGF
ncbi:MAG: hypothetical protein LQ345_005262 [Seirophora villosa]|nr:MAG: hypothetical protein LQ345_005262 [Seirophora villosa]